MEVKCIENIEDKKYIAEVILNNLPDWFGIPEAIDEYVRESSKMPFYACIDGNNTIGFIAIKQHNVYSAEIYVMGVDANYHRKGMGRLLVEECINWCRNNKIEFLQVKTLDETSTDQSYAKTREFYKALDFKPLECFPTLWDEWNPCLLMIKHIGGKKSEK